MILAGWLLLVFLADTESTPETWVLRLGSDDFATRELAESELSRLGLPALSSIEFGLNHADPEIRRRCRNLVQGLREADHQNKLGKFQKGMGTLPGWDRFCTLLPKERPETRKFYADIWASDPGFIEEVELNPDRAAITIFAKVQSLQSNSPRIIRANSPMVNPYTVNDVAAVMFAAQHPKARVQSDRLQLVTSLLYGQNIQGALSGKNGAVVHEGLRTLVTSWMRSQVDIQAQMQSLYLCQNLELKEGVLLARDLLKSGRLQPHGRGVACSLIGRLGTRENIPDIAPLLSDSAHMNNFQVRPREMGTVQVRDVALAILVHLTGQSHKDYGFGFATAGQAFQVGSTYNMGFLAEDKRLEALKKWDAYAQENKLPGRP
jgi:hypothetical protein